MKKNILLLLLVYMTSTHLQAQFDTSFIKQNIRRCADSLTDAFKARDYEKFTRYSYPALVGSFGGKKEFTEYITEMFRDISSSAWKQYEAGNILQVIKTEGDYQALIELKTIIDWENSRITTITPLLAESWDGGMFWTFFDTQGDMRVSLSIKPDLDPSIKIPEKQEKREPIKDKKQ